jgi:proteasome lid subunit RPN8/RPN11
MIAEIFIPPSIWIQMKKHVERELPLEACGILGGQDGKATLIIPIKNIYQSQTRFRMDPQAQIEAFIRLEDLDCELISIYHSHPRGNSIPSNEDIDQSFYPDVVQIIWSISSNQWDCRAYIIKNHIVEEIKIHILEEE